MSTLLAYHPPPGPTAAMSSRGNQAYLQTQVQSRTPVELVVMLYDAAITFLGQARDAMAARDLVTKRHALSRGLALIQELQNMLNMEAGGVVAARLDGLYTYVTGRCCEANAQRDPAGLDEAIKLLTPLRDAWAELAAQGPTSAA